MTSPHGLRCLIVDYGGVLTTAVGGSFDDWAARERVDLESLSATMSELLHDEAPENLVHRLERGEVSDAEFERDFAALIRRADGGRIESEGLLQRLFAAMGPADPMTDAVRRARLAGFSTALLSNSWGLNYDRTDWDALFDQVVISGEVGLRKPQREIYELAASRLEVRPQECVFVDDLAPNVRGAVSAGMVGIHHTSVDGTLTELESLLGVPLRG